VIHRSLVVAGGFDLYHLADGRNHLVPTLREEIEMRFERSSIQGSVVG
jgi:hypothetical protein